MCRVIWDMNPYNHEWGQKEATWDGVLVALQRHGLSTDASVKGDFVEKRMEALSKYRWEFMGREDQWRGKNHRFKVSAQEIAGGVASRIEKMEDKKEQVKKDKEQSAEKRKEEKEEQEVQKQNSDIMKMAAREGMINARAATQRLSDSRSDGSTDSTSIPATNPFQPAPRVPKMRYDEKLRENGRDFRFNFMRAPTPGPSDSMSPPRPFTPPPPPPPPLPAPSRRASTSRGNPTKYLFNNVSPIRQASLSNNSGEGFVMRAYPVEKLKEAFAELNQFSREERESFEERLERRIETLVDVTKKAEEECKRVAEEVGKLGRILESLQVRHVGTSGGVEGDV